MTLKIGTYYVKIKILGSELFYRLIQQLIWSRAQVFLSYCAVIFSMMSLLMIANGCCSSRCQEYIRSKERIQDYFVMSLFVREEIFPRRPQKISHYIPCQSPKEGGTMTIRHLKPLSVRIKTSKSFPFPALVILWFYDDLRQWNQGPGFGIGAWVLSLKWLWKDYKQWPWPYSAEPLSQK